MAIICTRVVFAIPDQNMDKLACRFRTGDLKHRVEVAKVCWQGGRHKKREQTSVVRAWSKNLQGADHPGISRALGSRSGETDRHAPQAFRAFVEKPASDLVLLEALTASITTAATMRPRAKTCSVLPAASSGGGSETKGHTHTNLGNINKKRIIRSCRM